MKTLLGIMGALACLSLCWAGSILAQPAAGQGQSGYVGNQKCRECHEEQFRNYLMNSRKVKSFANIKKMKKGLTAQEYRGCFECHTTGYGKPGGFRSEEETPQMRNPGCESCHGPGASHSQSQQASDIKGKLSVADCERCHNSERIEAFRFRPLIYGGGH